MHSVREILSETFKRERGIETNESIQLVHSYWEVAVGPQIASHAKPALILGKRLVVDVDGQEWRRELAAISRRIANAVNRAIGTALLEDVDFRVVSLHREKIEKVQPATSQTAQASPDEIKDPNLRHIYQKSKTKALAK